jgi:predicted NBD/HSP70 family sugar kinase
LLAHVLKGGSMVTLVIDIGGTNVKVSASGQEEVRKIPSGPTLTPQEMVDKVKATTGDWRYSRVSIGYPGPIRNGEMLKDPVNLGPGWMGFDFAGAFGQKVHVINDAAMQAIGSYEGGRMLFLGLGTGLGSAYIADKAVVPLELAHLPYRKGHSYEDYVGRRGLEHFGKKSWREFVADVARHLKEALIADYVVLGGGNSKKIKDPPPDCRIGSNRNAIEGGIRLWEDFRHL